MTPVLLDQRSIFKAGLTVSVGMLVVFFVGFYTGHQKAVSGKDMSLNTTIALALPGPAHADTTEFEQQPPFEMLPGADRDVDMPDDVTADDVSVQSAAPEKTKTVVESAIARTTDMIEKTAGEISAEQRRKTLQLASLATSPAAIVSGESDSVVSSDVTKETVRVEMHTDASSEADSPSNIVDTASLEDARYTIQVGVFADSSNAIRRQSELEAQELSAYINGYSNKKGELRFNVRFGYFNNKTSALAALDHFENHMSGRGYVARIRRN